MKRSAQNIRSSDSFWNNSFAFNRPNSEAKKRENKLDEFIASIDESPDFYDPYSDLNLFLSKKIKSEMGHCGSSKKWSLKIQEELLAKISPDFQRNFPQYRLGASALKKTWDKIAFYSEQIAQSKGALTKDGKLNTYYMIQENLKSYITLKSPLHPCHYAHQLASQIGECSAIMDGEHLKIDELTKLIWTTQRHLLPGNSIEQGKSPYDSCDKIDKLIVRTILDITAKEPQIGQIELEEKVKEALSALHELPSFSSQEMIIANVSALLAEKLFPSFPFLGEQKKAILNFIERHSALCKTATMHPQLTEHVRRITALYTLACGLPKNIAEGELKEAVLACYPIGKKERPPLAQALYAFISAELLLMRSEEFCRSPEYVTDALWTAYKEASLLPKLQSKEIDLLEIAVWKSLSSTEGLLEKLPYRIGRRIEEEIAYILVENPQQNFSSLVYATVQFFQKTKELIQLRKWSEIEAKIHLWSMQGDMLCRVIRLDPENPLLRLICKTFKEKGDTLSHIAFVSHVTQEELRLYPEISPYTEALSLRVWTLYKYAWYTLFSSLDESALDRFLKWHCKRIGNREDLREMLEEIATKTAPLIPSVLIDKFLEEEMGYSNTGPSSEETLH
ncbi:MAG: hypothetical protein JSS61_02890 [Verrucomicrobia bacterium]|nr:hypothetical protein [Verrucomicrobiota bacterium]